MEYRIIEWPPFTAATSGADSRSDFSGDGKLGRFDRWFSTVRPQPRDSFMPRPGYFRLLLVIGQKEKARVEALLPALSGECRRVYGETKEGMGQRWLLFTLRGSEQDALYRDVLRVIRIRRESTERGAAKPGVSSPASAGGE